jgi:uncharacterized protein YkwD
MEKAGSLDFSFRRKERCVMRRINSIRQNHGRSALQRDGHLGYVARLHAVKIANVLGLFHDDAFGTKVTNWERLGQNTGRGRTCRSVVRAFMSDQVHKDIILGPWRHQGVGISRGADGRIYVQHIFEARRDPGNVFGVG